MIKSLNRTILDNILDNGKIYSLLLFAETDKKGHVAQVVDYAGKPPGVPVYHLNSLPGEHIAFEPGLALSKEYVPGSIIEVQWS
ncbi:hypothetical protein PITCH_A1070014 [uncultured Desulfobacterium sp.]|uniref:Uncharacterized protein n=1 Tax=uncultured Desulfobacterium sp. TaxID=201089 RepID=A0A445MQV1_9BACT|nr:hypothetical protein PITCH_A1070014 [uncultured Desulfobacterium sp.]